MAKKNKTPLGIFSESIGLYFSNFDKFVQYMSFPVLGQIGGLGLVLLITFFYTQNLPNLLEKYSSLDNFNTLILLSILITLPGLAIFIKAFWDYLVAYGAINSMLDNMLKSGRVYDFDAHTELIKRRSIAFVGLWFLFGIFSTIAICPLLWVVCGILAIYFVLVFQVFTFEPELSPAGCVKRSLELVKGHFASTFMLMTFAGLLTYLFIPQIVIKVFDIANINTFLANLIMPIVNQLPDLNLQIYGIPNIPKENIALFTIQTIIAQILIQYTLPLRSILWSMWYRELAGNVLQAKEQLPKKRKSKRPSEKLMEVSHKKYGKKKLDSNILKRASEKDDD